MIAEKRKLFFSFLFNELLLHVAHTRDTVSSPDLMSCKVSDLTYAANPCLSAWLTSCSRCIAESDILVLVMQAVC